VSTTRETYIKTWTGSVLNSYSQVFYSLNKIFAAMIMAVTFFNPLLGACGLFAVIFTNAAAVFMGFDRKAVDEGLFGFGALLLGLALGYEYEINLPFVFLFMVALFMLLITTVLLSGFMRKHSLPVLSFPFLFTYWIVFIAAGSLTNIHLNEIHAYTSNEIRLNESVFYGFVHAADHVKLPLVALSYFKTLAGTFFIDSVLGGMVLAAGILYFSRIAFTLSLIGFGAAYFFYVLFGADVNDLNYHLLGSNFIFLAIGIGCFYLIPNVYSYIAVIVLTPVLVFLLLFFGKTLAVFNLKALTLPFSLLTTVFLYVLHQRWMHKFLHLVLIQYYSAEKTIYKYKTSLQRFKHAHLAKVSLPFWGQWQVSQGYNGTITHLGEWSKALDFVIVDDQHKTYKNPGTGKEDFYCYNKPVVAPLDGYVYDIINNVDDNAINDLDIEHNWGNTIIMNHLNGLFSQISHVKKDSFKVAIGEYVTKGTVLAACGNSGRSPEPHIHFQLQTMPTVGAKTLAYPIAYFIEYANEKQELKTFEVPEQNSIISNVAPTPVLLEAFAFLPGKKYMFKNENERHIHWEVFTDAYNRTYLYCHSSKSVAYFVQDGTMFYFTDFEGEKKSMLFSFYLAAYRVLMSANLKISVKDNVPIVHFNSAAVLWIQDFFAPFMLFTHVEYASTCSLVDNENEPSQINISSHVKASTGKLFSKKTQFNMFIEEKKIKKIQVTNQGITEVYTCVA
jgi:urea transporter/murein DD-endopeptidase MepM/ murein hydrolase activator NlpD